MKKVLALLLTLVTVLSLFSGCGGTSGDPQSGDGAASAGSDSSGGSGGTPSASGKDTIRVSLGGNVTTLDPMSTNAAVNQMLGNVVMGTLVDFDIDWNVIPNQASDWSISDDGMTYTFTLRDDVYFHSGDKLVAEDVVFSVERAINSSFLTTDWKFCTGAAAISDSEVEIYLSQPYTPFLPIVAKTLFLHNKSFYDDYIAAGGTDEQYQMELDGTGPYRFIEYIDGVSIEFEAFADYFKGEPAIKHWFGKIIADNNARAMAIETGDIDLIETHTTVPSSNLPLLATVDSVVIEQTDFEKVYSMPMNTTTPGLDNVLVRKAIAYAIDYEWLIDILTDGAGYETECAYLGHKTIGFSTADTLTHYNYDVERAKELLVEAGYPGGEGLPVMTATIYDGRKVIMEAIQSCLAEIGITVELNIVESGVVVSELRANNFDLGIISNNCMVDASMYNAYFSEDGIGSTNIPRYVNDEINALLDLAAVQLDPDERQATLDEAWTLITDQVPAVWLLYEPSVLIYAEGLHAGGTYPTQSVVRYEDMYWE